MSVDFPTEESGVIAPDRNGKLKFGMSDNSAANKPHLIVRDMVCHRPADGSNPTVIEHGFYRGTESDEQPYLRRTKVGTEWTPLDCGWVEQAAMIILVNDEGVFRQTNPEKFERNAAEAKIMEIGMMGDLTGFALVGPGESLRFRPVDCKALRLRSKSGECRFKLAVFSE